MREKRRERSGAGGRALRPRLLRNGAKPRGCSARLAPLLDPATRIVTAFADLAGPSLPDALAALAAEGVGDAVVVTCMVPADPTHAAWLAGALSQWSIDTRSTMTVRIAPPVEAHLDLAAAVAASLRDPASIVRETRPSLGKPGWSKVPEHGRQLFFCVGARCLHRGAEPLYQHLRKRLRADRALSVGPRRVMCARSGCLYPCNLGPLLVVHPDGAWYGGLTQEGIDRIVDEHLGSDRAVDQLLVARSPNRAGCRECMKGRSS